MSRTADAPRSRTQIKVSYERIRIRFNPYDTCQGWFHGCLMSYDICEHGSGLITWLLSKFAGLAARLDSTHPYS